MTSPAKRRFCKLYNTTLNFEKLGTRRRVKSEKNHK